MAFDYSQLYEPEDGVTGTWRELYNHSQALPWNVQNLLEKTVFLEHDYYDLVASYILLPSALCKLVPYLFFYGQSGSGKSTIAKLASYVHGVSINSSSDTFAGIRNSLNDRRYGYAELPMGEEDERTWNKKVEVNTCMVWDDIDASVFTNNQDLYRLFKFGYDRRTDKIILSSKEVGENLEFRCFCPKMFSSISPLHLDDRFRELRRRLIVIPCKRVEDLSKSRRDELGITLDDWQTKLIDIDDYSWKNFDKEFKSFWDMELAKAFIETRRVLSKTVRGLSSQQRAISLDLLACGIASGIWSDEDEAIDRIKTYWQWFKSETEQSAGLGQLLKEHLRQQEKNAQSIGIEPKVSVPELRNILDAWYDQGWLLERPRATAASELMLDLGWKVNKGIWSK